MSETSTADLAPENMPRVTGAAWPWKAFRRTFTIIARAQQRHPRGARRPRGQCRHCGKLRALEARGLCCRCHRDRAIRAQYVNTASTRSKLNSDKVRAIRKRAADGEDYLALARAYGVSTSSIKHVVWRKNWNHVE